MKLATAVAFGVVALLAVASGNGVIAILAGAATYAFARSARKDYA